MDFEPSEDQQAILTAVGALLDGTDRRSQNHVRRDLGGQAL